MQPTCVCYVSAITVQDGWAYVEKSVYDLASSTVLVTFVEASPMGECD